MTPPLPSFLFVVTVDFLLVIIIINAIRVNIIVISLRVVIFAFYIKYTFIILKIDLFNHLTGKGSPAIPL